MPIFRVFCWAILFLLRLRFPPGLSSTCITLTVHLQSPGRMTCVLRHGDWKSCLCDMDVAELSTFTLK